MIGRSPDHGQFMSALQHHPPGHGADADEILDSHSFRKWI
jgi:hypothetical protein